MWPSVYLRTVPSKILDTQEWFSFMCQAGLLQLVPNWPLAERCGFYSNHFQNLPGRLSFPAVNVSESVAEYFLNWTGLHFEGSRL
jgi:hypothetical protein